MGTIFYVPGVNGGYDIAAAPDGNMWVAQGSSVAKITPAGVVSTYTVTTPSGSITGLTAGPDGNVWATIRALDAIARITPAGVVTTFTGAGIDHPYEITPGPDGNLWFTNNVDPAVYGALSGSIGRITPAGVVSQFTGVGISAPVGIATGSDGNLWFTNSNNSSIGRITPAGVVSNFAGSGIWLPLGIAAGPDGNLWFADRGAHAIGRISPAGVVSMFSSAAVGSPWAITTGPDGNLWFTDTTQQAIGQVTPTGVITTFAAPEVTTPLGIAAGPDGNVWFAGYGAVGRVVVLGPGPPSPPSSPSASSGVPGSAVVSWTASTDDGGAGPVSYTATSSPGGLTCTTATTTCTVSGLDPLTAYTFTVRATNAANASSAASVATSPAVTPGPAPAPVVSSLVAGPGQVTVGWSALAPSPNSFTVSSMQGTTAGPTCTTSTTSCVVTGLTDGVGYTFVVTANYAGGTTQSAASAKVFPTTRVDLAASSTVPASLKVARSGSFTAVEGVTNKGTVALPARMTLTVAAATEVAITIDPGLTCGAPVLDAAGTGFSRVCTSDSPLAAGASLHAALTVVPASSPTLTAVKVTNTVSVVAGPAIPKDTTATNNKVIKTLKITDAADLSFVLTGASSVARGGSYVANGTLTNTGTNAVFAKVTIPVANATETGFTADAGLSCKSPVANGAGTGYTRTCLTIAPLAPGASLHVQLTLSPSANPSVHSFTVTGTAAKASGNVVDPVSANNKATRKVTIVG